MRRGGQWHGRNNRKHETVKLSKCCNAIVAPHWWKCNICGSEEYKYVPKYKEIQKGIYREIIYKTKTRHILIEKINND